MDIRSLRSLVLSRLPVIDIYLVPISGADDQEDDKPVFELADSRETPEEKFLKNEAEMVAIGFVDKFLESLHASVNGKAKQYNRMINILWHCYLSANGRTQLEIAAKLGVSDSLVSDYRRRIEQNLRELSFSGINEARRFEQELKRRVSSMISDQTNLAT
ncbi:MAG: sigma-70 family RNA polymerase sigma factor [Acidobacteria bacterium]|nr:MAG: sigma-70 family RNA polymerase sigma factor [Acidobacteriota bacterium]